MTASRRSARATCAATIAVLVILVASAAASDEASAPTKRSKKDGYCYKHQARVNEIREALLAEGDAALVSRKGDELAEAFREYRETTKAGARRGHLIPGLMWILWASWWYLHVCVYWVRRKSRALDLHKARHGRISGHHGHRRLLSLARHGDCASRAWMEGVLPYTRLAEPWFKLVAPAFGIFAELYFHAPNDICFRHLVFDGEFDKEAVNVWVHTALYGAIAFSGLVDFLVHCKFLPSKFDKVVHLLVFVNQGMLFGVHLGGSHLSVMMHKILVGLTFCYVVAAALDFFVVKGDFVAAFMRSFLLVLMGAWITFAGRVLFPDGHLSRKLEWISQTNLAWFTMWQKDQHLSMMVVPLYLSLFALTAFVSMMLLLWVVTFLMSGCSFKGIALVMSESSEYRSLTANGTKD